MTEERRQELNRERIATLIPELQAVCMKGMQKLEDGGFHPFIVEARRSQDYQNALYAQGRETLEEVNRLRALADKDLISPDENRHVVTWTKESKHILGKAFDIVSVNDGAVDWDDKNFISMSVVIYESLGLISGSRWHTKDVAHFEVL